MSLFTAAVIAAAISAAAAPTPEIVHKYYSSVKGLSTNDDNEAFDYELAIQSCFEGFDDRSYSGPNIIDTLFGYNTITSKRWAQVLKEKIHVDRELSISDYTVQRTDRFMQPALKKSTEDEILVSTVSYTYMRDNRKHYNLEYVGVINNEIFRISDKAIGADAASLTIEAAKLYTAKKYKEAYDTYQRILTADPDNPNILFRIGIMTALGRGTKRNDMLARSYLLRVDDALRKSYRNNKPTDWNLSKKAADAIYYIDHPQPI